VAAGNRALIRLRHAKDLLQLVLADGAQLVPAIWAAAEEKHISRSTLKRAKKELKIRSKKIYIDKVQHNYWLLPGQELPPPIQALWDEIDPEPFLAPVRARFPEPTPLDDV
jgi:hypothetical protein